MNNLIKQLKISIKFLSLKKLNQEKKQFKAERILKDIPHIYSWIGSRVDWLTAGERRNILYTFTVYASQIILKNPISLVALGDSSSDKTHIQNTAISLLPRDYVVDEKKITESAFFLRAQQDKYFYDGKIVNYGDMGGDNDQDFMYEAKNLMKELQSEEYLKKNLKASPMEVIVGRLKNWN